MRARSRASWVVGPVTVSAAGRSVRDWRARCMLRLYKINNPVNKHFLRIVYILCIIATYELCILYGHNGVVEA
jgi:hypothetical protein